MCYFITVGLPEDKAEFLDRQVPRGFHIAPIANLSVLQQMGQGFRTYLLMSGGCSCELFRKSPTETDGDQQTWRHSKQERFRQRFEKMGWSPAKIDRALAQRSKGRRETFTGLRSDVQCFLGKLAMNVGQLAVVIHWYHGDVREARLACKQGGVVSPEAAIAEGLILGTDEIVRIKAGVRS